MFNLGSIGAFGGGLMDRLSQNDIDALNRLKLAQERANQEADPLIASLTPGDLSNLGGGAFNVPQLYKPQPQTPAPGQPSTPAQPQLASAGATSGITAGDLPPP